jgi:hypothetical protein
MTNTAPYEIICAPFQAWLAPVGTTFPFIEAEPGIDWTLIGTSGDRNTTEDGVTVKHEQTIEEIRTLGSIGPVKAHRTEEGLKVSFVLADMSLEHAAVALNHNAVTTVAPGVHGGYKKIGLSRGRNLVERALLLRGAASPYGNGETEDWNMQYQVLRAVQIGEAEVVYTKGGDPAGYALEFLCLEDPDAASDDERFGVLLAQNADPT